MKKLAMVLLSVLVLSGCDNGATYKDNREEDVYIKSVRGIPLECIFEGHGLSCNWEAWNKKVQGDL